MLRHILILVAGMFIMANAGASCTLKRGHSTVLTIPTETIMISADAAVDTSKPIVQYDSSKLSANIGYDDCTNGTAFGGNTTDLNSSNGGLFATNIPGISAKLLVFYNASRSDTIPFEKHMQFSGGEGTGTADFNAGFFYRVEFYKTSANLGLSSSPDSNNIVLGTGERAYFYVITPSPSSSDLNLNIGEIKIYSTPSCTIDKTKNIDFGIVTKKDLTSSGIERNLDFNLTCKTDYGSYSATASISATDPSSDSQYITVKDATGKNNSLGIKISDSKDQPMLVNGTSTEIKNNINSNTPAQFNWKAKLIPIDGASQPTSGKFTAQAEIILQVK